MTVKLPPTTIQWMGDLDGYVELIDQTRLPTELVHLQIRDAKAIWHAIKTLQVRGAPAIGIAAAMGAVLGIRSFDGNDRTAFFAQLESVCQYLASSRPTAVNLVWALNRLRQVARGLISTEAARTPIGLEPSPLPLSLGGRGARATEPVSIQSLKLALLDEAKRIRDEDEVMCRAIGRHGERLVHEGCGILTHCNAGSLATSRYGTALAPMYAAYEAGRRFHVFVDETRPLLQGSRLTAWELHHAGISATLICDSMAAAVMRDGRVQLVITGADRIAANGDVANKIGTYGVAVLAKAHGIPFYVAAPSSTFDLSIADGRSIPIESRDPTEIRCGFGKPTAPAEIECFNPAFDVTPASLVRGIITERGIIEPVKATEIVRKFCVDEPVGPAGASPSGLEPTGISEAAQWNEDSARASSPELGVAGCRKNWPLPRHE